MEDELITFIEVVESHESDKWRTAIEDEIKSLHKNETWMLVDKIEKQNLVG